MKEGYKMKKIDLLKRIEASKARSAWARGVRAYAEEIIAELEVEEMPESALQVKMLLLNGAKDWKQYSWGGSSLIYNADIAQRLCNRSEWYKTRGGMRRPNSREEWLDTQARALYQAERLIQQLLRE